jgi:uncharacterized integral membrane protein (TIGR00697 family)
MKNHYKYLGFITCLYITLQLVSDVTAGKIISLFSFPVSVTVLFFPMTYIFSDILTEVYGYRNSRNVLWTVLIASVLAGLIYIVVVLIPPSQFFDANAAYTRVLGQVPRILVGGWLAVFAGDIVNNYVMAKMKIWTGGKFLWTRTVGSTVAGQFVNTVIFYTIGLYGVLSNNILVISILSGWILKVIVEIVFTPLTYLVTGKLKKIENMDYYDTDTDFNPFKYTPPF